jgi:hypothetical protein
MSEHSVGKKNLILRGSKIVLKSKRGLIRKGALTWRNAILGPMAATVSSSSLVSTVLSDIHSGTSFFSTCRFVFSPKVMFTCRKGQIFMRCHVQYIVQHPTSLFPVI